MNFGSTNETTDGRAWQSFRVLVYDEAIDHMPSPWWVSSRLFPVQLIGSILLGVPGDRTKRIERSFGALVVLDPGADVASDDAGEERPFAPVRRTIPRASRKAIPWLRYP